MTNELKPKETQPDPATPAVPPVEPDQTLTSTPQQDTTPEKTFSQTEVEMLLSKVRSEEKSKVFQTVEELKAVKKELTETVVKQEEALKDTQGNLEELRAGKVTELKSVNEELAKQREVNAKLEKAIEHVATDSMAKILEAELSAYRDKQLRLKEITPELEILVTGKTKEEIDASIEAAKEKETKLKESLREEVRGELAANLPTPISADGSQGRGPTPNITSENRESIARLEDKEYIARRQEMLEEAKIKAGHTP
jgi:hypothetical protein